MKYDFVVIGAGAAGSYFCDLASKYSSVLLLDKSTRGRINSCSGIFPKHNYSFFNDDSPLPLDDKKIFPCDHYTLTYSTKQYDGTIDGREFGSPLGKMANIDELNKFLLERAEKNGAELKFNIEVKKISISDNEATIFCNNGEEYKADVVIIATGPGDISKVKSYDKTSKRQAFHLQTSLGFEAPDLYFAAATKYTGDSDLIEKNIPTQYNYHLNRKISPFGPLFTTKWVNQFYIGVIHEDYNIAVKKLVAVTERYKRVQPYFRGMKRFNHPHADNINGLPIFRVAVTKHPVNKLVKNRVLLLGDAAGFVTGLFYEGVVGALGSAKIASDLLKELINLDVKEKYNDSPQFLGRYKRNLKKTVLKYIDIQKQNEATFLDSGDAGETIMSTYARLLSEKKNKELRHYGYEVLVMKDLTKYNDRLNRLSGEAIYKGLPIAQKVICAPVFLKALMN
ncbi:MAG: NAD(P)/FAD-dependent oxidoreductase [archaeon]|nr:NAD(P)/FAD-dependent oxidoreductase [archaeon]